MKRATCSFSLIILFLFIGLGLDAGTTISKIQYFPGEDFVQVHMQTDKILPIPDIFYPDKNDLKRLVMRIRDVEFRVAGDSLTFDSPVIRALNVRKAEGHCDVEIMLKGEVNYRVFTNQTGLYIEFPVLKDLAIAAAPAPEPIASPKPAAAPPAAAAVSGRVGVRDIRVASQAPGRIRFELDLSAPTDYRVIPIEQQPVRLAIDLKNAQSRKIHKPVNLKNVKTVRGGNNTSDVYRVVFDLNYLKHFAVQAKGSLLQVDFFDDPQHVQELTSAADPPPIVVAETPQPAASRAETPAAETAVTENRPRKVVLAPPAPPAAKPVEFFGPEKSKAGQEVEPTATPPVSDAPANVDFQKKTVDEGRPQYSGEPYDFSFKNADISNILKFIAKISGLNMVIDPDVTGRFTCELVQVPWDQALELILKVNGLDMIQEGNILRIGKVEKLAQEAKRRQELREAREQEGNLEFSTRTLSYAKVKDIQSLLKRQMSPRGELVIDERTNTLIISEVPERMKVIDGLIDTLDAANPQVQIEARIVETTSESLSTFGIQWGVNAIANSSYGNQTNLVFPNSIVGTGVVDPRANPNGYVINVPTADSVVFPKITLGNIAGTFNLDVALSALASKGKARIISSPRATTQNNMPAEITQGERIPIQTNQNNTITTQYINAALELKVTPQITARGSVIMTIDIKNDSADFTKPVLGMPTISTKTAKTSVMVNDGGTIVIGGFYSVKQDSSNTGVPILSKIPILGSLFRNSRKYGKTQELMIFITPRIVK
ncbi:MAG: type IV pilus secretin PilQ [Candidatus Aminicenantes bacterium]|nr:type IV pilus secretin PilQ [Candidatus Aminicenantes bacterium]